MSSEETERPTENDMSNEPQEYEIDSEGYDAEPEQYDIESEPTACAYTDYSERGQSPEELPATGEGATGLEKRVWDALYAIEDPEMPISIVDLGLIYGVQIEGNSATVIMTLTYTGCPARKMLTEEIEEAVADVSGVESVDLELVWSPPWSIEMVTEQGKDDLRDFGLSI